jgi:hypothetical protein
VSGDYSEVAAQQLDALERSADDDFWDAILDACDLALNHPSEAQKHSSAVVREDGHVVFRLAVTGHPPYKVFWSVTAGTPRIEAVFPHP